MSILFILALLVGDDKAAADALEKFKTDYKAKETAAKVKDLPVGHHAVSYAPRRDRRGALRPAQLADRSPRGESRLNRRPARFALRA